MNVNITKINQIMTENSLVENIIAVPKAECKELNKQEIYGLHSTDHFIIDGGELLDKKDNLKLSFGWIVQSSFTNFKTSRSIFNNVNFDSVYIKASQFYSSVFINCSFEDVDFDSCRFQDTYFINCTFDPTSIKDGLVNNCAFYHCVRDRLKIDDDILNNFGFLDSEESVLENELEVTEEVTEFEETENDKDVNALQEGQIYQFKKIRKECFELKKKIIREVIISDCELAFNHIYTYFDFIDCKFINLNFTALNSLFTNNEFTNCEFSGIHLDTEIIECSFDSCKFENVTLSHRIRESQFNNCEFDNRELFLSFMDETTVEPKVSDMDEMYINSTGLFKGYKTILVTTLIQAQQIATEAKDSELLEKLLKLVNDLGGKLPPQEEVIEELKKQITKLSKKDQKELFLFIQNILFQNI